MINNITVVRYRITFPNHNAAKRQTTTNIFKGIHRHCLRFLPAVKEADLCWILLFSSSSCHFFFSFACRGHLARCWFIQNIIEFIFIYWRCLRHSFLWVCLNKIVELIFNVSTLTKLNDIFKTDEWTKELKEMGIKLNY